MGHRSAGLRFGSTERLFSMDWAFRPAGIFSAPCLTELTSMGEGDNI